MTFSNKKSPVFKAFRDFYIKASVKDPGLFLSAAGTKKVDVFKCAERSIQTLFHMLDFKYAQPCLYPGIDQAGEINEHPTAFNEVRKATLALIMA